MSNFNDASSKPRGPYYSTDVVYPWPKVKVNNREIADIIEWIRDHCYPNVFDRLSKYPTEGPDRKVNDLIFEDETNPDELIEMLITLDKNLGRMFKIPF